MYFTSKGQSVHYRTRGWFLKIFRWRICFPCNYYKVHNSFIVCRIPFSQEYKLLQSFTEQYFIVNKLFWENWVKLKIQNLPIRLYSESVLHIRICTVWIGHNLLTSFISKLSQVYTQANTHGEVAKIQPPEIYWLNLKFGLFNCWFSDQYRNQF